MADPLQMWETRAKWDKTPLPMQTWKFIGAVDFPQPHEEDPLAPTRSGALPGNLNLGASPRARRGEASHAHLLRLRERVIHFVRGRLAELDSPVDKLANRILITLLSQSHDLHRVGSRGNVEKLISQLADLVLSQLGRLLGEVAAGVASPLPLEEQRGVLESIIHDTAVCWLEVKPGLRIKTELSARYFEGGFAPGMGFTIPPAGVRAQPASLPQDESVVPSSETLAKIERLCQEHREDLMHRELQSAARE